MKKFLAFTAGAAFLAGLVSAQAQEPPPQDVLKRVEHVEVRTMGPAGAATHDTFAFIAAEGGVPGKVVKGASYTAEAVTESVQTLADGNRITHRSSSTLARDSEGRTRREQTLPAIGPWAAENGAPKMIFISDPVSKLTWMFDEKQNTVRKMPFGTTHMGEFPRVAAPGGVRTMSNGPAHVEVQVMRRSAGPESHVARLPGESRTETLGQRNIEGVIADGTRNVMTIPAGAAGNERPIEVVTERWYSPELQVTVLSKHNDPRFGETTYKLTKISRSEPPKSLFEPPADKQVIEGGPGPVEIRIRKEK